MARRELNALQLRALDMLVQGMKYTDVSAELKITRNTLWKWRQTEEFKKELENRTNQIREEVYNKLKADWYRDIEVLREFIEDETRSDGIRLAAVKMHLDHSVQSNDASDIIEKLEELKIQIEGRLDGKGRS